MQLAPSVPSMQAEPLQSSSVTKPLPSAAHWTTASAAQPVEPGVQASAAQTPASQYCAAPQSVSALHSTQCPSSVLQSSPDGVQSLSESQVATQIDRRAEIFRVNCVNAADLESPRANTNEPQML